jgi:hypothetical protein
MTEIPAFDLDWYPIETAPKNKGAILVHCPYRKNTYTAIWGIADGSSEFMCWKHFGGGGDIFQEIKYWMPLPNPPEDK